MQVKTKKRLIALLLLLLTACAVWAGWTWYDANVDRSGWVNAGNVVYYRDFHGQKVTGWQEIEGKRYHFDKDNTLSTGWLADGGNCYYLGNDGAMVTFWQEIEGKRYFFSENGIMHIGWLELENERYYLDNNGVLLTGWHNLHNQFYYFDEDGHMHTGWLQEEEQLYYLSDEGPMYTGWLELDGQRFFLSEAGPMVTGWLEWEGNRFFLNENGNPLTGWATLEENTYFFDKLGSVTTGWADLEDARYYFSAEGILQTGWLELDGHRYYLDTEGRIYTGWLELGEYDYYLKEDGTAAVGPTEIEGEIFYFTPKGIHVTLVNRWHPVSTGEEPELVSLENNQVISTLCAEAVMQMLADCRKDGLNPLVTSGYRSYATQQDLFSNRVNNKVAEGMEYNAAWGEVSRSVAIPGTSEHHLGLALDISGAKPTSDNQIYQWLAEHCWEYGFILRYLEGKSAITGIYYEPWHVRYVGTEVSLDMKDSGLCLEEYLGAANH